MMTRMAYATLGSRPELIDGIRMIVRSVISDAVVMTRRVIIRVLGGASTLEPSL